jgi:hypothetical protein
LVSGRRLLPESRAQLVGAFGGCVRKLRTRQSGVANGHRHPAKKALQLQ